MRMIAALLLLSGSSVGEVDDSALCQGKGVLEVTAKLAPSLAVVRGGKGRRLDEFLRAAEDEARRALVRSGGKFELRLVEFREASRTRNLAASMSGGVSVDAGHYRFELLRPDRPEVLATFESRPSIRSLVLGNSFSRLSAMRGNFRAQMKSLGARCRAL